MTGAIAIAQRRFNAATLFAAMVLVTAGLVIGFALAQYVSIGSVGGPAVAAQGTQVGVDAAWGVQGLSPDERQALRDSGQVTTTNVSSQFGGLSPDERHELPSAP